MPLRDDLLNPIPGPNPSGENLRYAPVYDKIKEARREEDDPPQGEWQRDRKVANYPQVIKLASDALAAKPKDLHLAAWMTEALLKVEGFAWGGRGRFQRRMQVARVCLSTGHEQVAAPILEQLAEEVEQRRLEEWETAEVVAHPLGLLYRCMSKLERRPGGKEKVHTRICRLDPIQALSCAR